MRLDGSLSLNARCGEHTRLKKLRFQLEAQAVHAWVALIHELVQGGVSPWFKKLLLSWSHWHPAEIKRLLKQIKLRRHREAFVEVLEQPLDLRSLLM